MKALRIALIALTLLFLATLSALLYLRHHAQPPLPVFDTLGGDFVMPSTRAGVSRLGDLRGKPVLLNFGYASCPSVCPTVLLRMRRVLEELGEQASEVQPLFVTIDPERDELQALESYVKYFHPSFIAMRGDEQQTRRAAELYKVYYKKEAPGSATGYDFVHSSQIYLLDRELRVRATYGGSVTKQQIGTDIRGLLDE